MKGSSSRSAELCSGITRRRFIAGSAAGSFVAALGNRADGRGTLGSDPGLKKDGVGLSVIGDEEGGYAVELLHGKQPVARHNQGGEFSAIFRNADRSLEDRVENWKAASWSGDRSRVILQGPCNLRNLNATVFATVEYSVIDFCVVRKIIRLRQTDMFSVYFQISNCLEPVEPPTKFWSFDQRKCRGGALHENFPAAGFRTKTDLCVGLLTDSGVRNRWSRIIRRDGKPVKPAPRRIPDAFLYEVSTFEECKKGQFFVKQNFGEALEQILPDQPIEAIYLPEPSHWVKRGQAAIGGSRDVTVLTVSNPMDGVLIPIQAAGGAVYSLQIEYRSPEPIAIQIWDVDAEWQKLQEATLYNDTVPKSVSEWSVFRTNLFLPAWKGIGGAIFISLPPSEQAIESRAPAETKRIEFRKLEMHRLDTHRAPCDLLEMDRRAEKTAFLFVDKSVPDTLRGYRMASQIHLADGLGFRGGETEKVLYADLMMLCWNAEMPEYRPMLAPSIWYSAAGEMYLRDSFFALNGVHNRELNEGVFNLWAKNQGEDGAINTLVEPNMANVERKSNDSTPLWLMWALLNRRRFGTSLPMEKVQKAAEYCLRTYDRRRDGVSWAQFVMGQLDVISYPQGTSEICENQGNLAVTLRVIKELRIPALSETISEEYIQKAEEVYRSYYDPSRKFLVAARGITDGIGFAELFPEFLSLWLFKRKLLSDEMIANHLDRIPVLLPMADSPHPEMGGTVRPIYIGLPDDGGWRYFTDQWHPMVSNAHAAGYAQHAMDGVYYNGGSWMRAEICGYVAGMLHGWNGAKKAIDNRLWAEIHVSPDFPTSQEYLATAPANPFFGYHRVFAWNSFVLQALELAGMRSPEMDPDFRKTS